MLTNLLDLAILDCCYFQKVPRMLCFIMYFSSGGPSRNLGDPESRIFVSIFDSFSWTRAALENAKCKMSEICKHFGGFFVDARRARKREMQNE